MATKKTAAPAASNGKAPAARLDILVLDEKIQDRLEDYVDWQSPYRKQLKVVEELKAKLTFEEARLEIMAEPLRRLEELLDPEQLKKLGQRQPYDEALKAIVARIRMKKPKYWGSKQEQSTGAVSWSALAKDGASDEQIAKNLDSLPDQHHVEPGDYKLDGPGVNLVRATTTHENQMVLKGKDAVIAAVRRVLGIPSKAEAPKPAPSKATKGAKKTPAAKRTKKPASPAKSSKRPAPTRKSSAPQAGLKTPPKKKSSKAPGPGRAGSLAPAALTPGSSNRGLPKKPKPAQGKTTRASGGTATNKLQPKVSEAQRQYRIDVMATLGPMAAELLGELIDRGPGPVRKFEIENACGYAVAPAATILQAWEELLAKDCIIEVGKPSARAHHKFYLDHPPALETPATMAGKPGNVAAHAALAARDNAAIHHATRQADAQPGVGGGLSGMATKLLDALTSGGAGPHSKPRISAAAGYQPGGKVSKAWGELLAAGKTVEDMGRGNVRLAPGGGDAK